MVATPTERSSESFRMTNALSPSEGPPEVQRRDVGADGRGAGPASGPGCFEALAVLGHLSMRGDRSGRATPLRGRRPRDWRHKGSPHPEAGAKATLEGRGRAEKCPSPRPLPASGERETKRCSKFLLPSCGRAIGYGTCGGAAFLTLPLVGRVAGRREGFCCGAKTPPQPLPTRGRGSTCRPMPSYALAP